jgi:tetratricopeptide (TPR) repeat protein
MNQSNIGIVCSFFLGLMFIAIYILSNMQSFNLVWLIGAIFFFILVLNGLYGKRSISSNVYKIMGVPLVIIGIFLVVYVFLMIPESYKFSIIILSLIVLPFILIFVIFLVNLWLKTHKYQKGSELLEDFRYQEVLQFFEEFTKSDPEDPLAWSGKSLALLRFDRLDEAVECADKALKIKLGFKYFLIKNHIQNIRIYTKACVLFELEQYKDALKCSNELLKLNKNNSHNWNIKGGILNKLGNYEEALESLNEALRLDPKNPYALCNKGETLKKMGNYSEAMKYIDKALDINPKLPFIWFTKGETLRDMNKNEEALKYIEKALELDPIFKPAVKAKEELLNSKS